MTTPPRFSARSNGTLLGVLIVLLLIAVLALSGPSWIEVVYRLCVEGPILLAWLLAAYGLGALLPLPSRERAGVRVETPHLQEESAGSIFATVTHTALGLGVLSLLTLILGLLGWLNQITAISIIALGIVTAILHLHRRQQPLADSISIWLSRPTSWNWLWIVAIPFLAIAVVGALVPPGLLWGGEPHGYDVLEYHLQVPREWHEIGRIVPLEHNVFAYFPFNVEMHFLLAMHLRGGPWAGMYLAQLMHVGFVLLSVLAVYGFANELSDRKVVAILAGLAAASVPWLTLLAPIAYNEGGLLLFGTLAIGWTIRAIRSRETSTHDLLVAGALTGLACGTKLTAVPMLLVGLPAVCLLIRLVCKERELVRAAKGLAGFLVAGLLLFSPWLIRNAVWTGNPVFPEATGLFGQAHFSDVQVERWQRAHAAPQSHASLSGRLNAALHTLLLDWRFGYVLIPLGLIGAVQSLRRIETQFLLLLLALLLLFWLGFTHLQGRFFVLGIPILALLIASARWEGLRLSAVLAVVAAAPVGHYFLAKRPANTWQAPARMGVLGLEELDRLLAVDLAHLPPDATLVLVGDARAFLYPLPMSRLRYRTVFDVQTKGNENLFQAWAGDPPAGRTFWLIDAPELRRFASTYWQIPAPPEEYRDAGITVVPAPQAQRSP